MPDFAQAWARALPFMPWSLRPHLHNLRVDPVWFADGHGFWYLRERDDGVEHMLVDAETGTKAPAFDRRAMLAALAALDSDPAQALARLELMDRSGRVVLDGRVYRFDGRALALEQDRQAAPDELLSPDGRFALFRRAGDLWLRCIDSGAQSRLTDSAEAHFEWAKSPDQNLENIRLMRQGVTLPPVALWSPDSRRVLTYQLDERRVRSLPLVQGVPDDGSLRPRLHEFRVAFAGDPVLPMAHQAVIEVSTGRIIQQQGAPQHVTETSILERREAWWAARGDKVYFLDHDRFETRISLMEMDAATGATREVRRETADTFVDVNMEFGRAPNVALLDATNEAIWFSQRDGWAHLYLIDLSDGRIKRQLTKGDWVVRDLLAVNAKEREVVFLAGGLGERDTPYQRKVCAVTLDDAKLRVLTPERGDHDVAMRGVGWADMIAHSTRLTPQPCAVSPGGRYLVATRAPMDGAPVTVLRRIDGTPVTELERSQIGREGIILPQPVTALAADGETPIHSMIWLPEGVGEAADASVPVLEMIYPGPQCIEQPLCAFPADRAEFFKTALAGAIAKLGIAVIITDARGTPFRSKAFHDFCHGRLHDPGCLPDHAAALRALFLRFPALDPGRVAIMGHSAGGHAAARAILAHGDVWQVAVATAGCHNPRIYNHAWPEKWNGPLIPHGDGSDSFTEADNNRLASALRGALLLGHGEMDDNVPPAQTQRFAQALIEADRDFEQLLTPNDDHYSFPKSPYVTRRVTAFLCRHLQPGRDPD